MARFVIGDDRSQSTQARQHAALVPHRLQRLPLIDAALGPTELYPLFTPDRGRP